MYSLIRQKIGLQLLGLYLLFVIPVLLGGAALYLYQQNVLTQNAFQADLALSQAVALEVDSNLRAATEIDSELSTAQAAKELNLKQLASDFANASNAHPDINLYFVCDPSGKILISYPFSQGTVAQNFRTSKYFQKALTSDVPVISSGGISTITDTFVVSIAARITNDKGRLVGVMVINLSLDQLTTRLNTVHQRLSPSSEVGLWVIDRDGGTIASTKGIFAFLNLPEDYSGLIRAAHEALQGNAGNFIKHGETRDWLYSYVPIPEEGWAVVVQRPTDVTFATLTDFQHGLIAALILLVLGASFFWFMMHRRVISPLTRLAKAVSLIRPDQPIHDMHTASLALVHERRRQDEIGNLVTAFSAMERQMRLHFQKSDETIQAQFYTLDAIMRSMDEGVLLESPDGRIVYANRIFSRAVGIPQQELIDSSIKSLHLQERLATMLDCSEAYHKIVEPLSKGRGPHIVEFQLRGSYRARGQFAPALRDIHMRFFHVRDAKGVLIGRGRIFQDITKQNEGERIKRNLLAIVSHELRTPLTAIKGFATSLLEEVDGELDRDWQHYSLGQIVTESNRMADLVTNLLEMAQVEAGTLKLNPGVYQLRSLIEDTLVIAPNEQNRIAVLLPEVVPLLYVDGRRIQIVLRNILENALRYGGPEVFVEISATYEQAKKQTGLTLHIADNGPGIPPYLAERIFDRFYQIESGHERSNSGVGLGLAICRGFVEAHGGRIWADNRSDGGCGAVFHLWFPPLVLRIQERQYL